MNTKVKHVLAMAAVALMAVAANGADTLYKWVGGASGKWAVAANWEVDGQPATDYPGGMRSTTETQVAMFVYSSKNPEVVVEVDQDVSFSRIYLQARTTQTSEAISAVRVTGEGKMTLNATATTLTAASAGAGAYRKLVFDGLEVASKYQVFQDGGSIEYVNGANVTYERIVGGGVGICRVASGSMVIGSNSPYANIREGSTLCIDGGELYSAVYITQSGYGYGNLVVKDGLLRLRMLGANCLEDNIDFTGGTVRLEVKTNLVDNTFLKVFTPVNKGSTLDILNRLTGSANTETIDYAGPRASDAGVTARDLLFAGTIQATNANPTVFAIDRVVGTVGQRGSLILPKVEVKGAGTRVGLDLDTLVLKEGLSIADDAEVTVKKDMTVGAYGADWTSYTAEGSLWLGGTLTIDTTDWKDKATARTVYLSGLMTGEGQAAVAVKGCGTADLAFVCTNFTSLRSISVAAGATLRLANTGAKILRTDLLKLGPGATLELTAGQMLDAVRSEIDPTAHVKIVAKSTLKTARLVQALSAGAVSSALADAIFTLDNKGSVNWSIAHTGTDYYLTNGATVTPTVGKSGYRYWQGVTEIWSNAQNWSDGTASTTAPDAAGTEKNYYAYFYDSPNLAINVDTTDAWVRDLEFKSDVPYVLTGESIKVQVANTVQSASKAPVVIDALIKSQKSSSTIVANADASVTLGKGLTLYGDAANHVNIVPWGDIRLGGTTTVVPEILFTNNFQYSAYKNARPNKLSVLPGGSVTVTRQSRPFTYTGTFNVGPNATLTFASGCSPIRFQVGELWHTVDGTLDIGAAFGACEDQHFFGSGRVKLADTTAASATARMRIGIGGGLTLLPKAWTTASEAGSATALTVETDATLGATGDWTYGPATDVLPTTTADDRALVIADGATLTVDTTDADDAAIARTITITEKVAGDALVLKGVGTLGLAEGASVRTFAVGAGTPALCVAADKTVAVAETASVGGLKLCPETAEWRTVLTARSIVGTATAADGAKVRMVTRPDGTQVLQARLTRGLLLLFR